MTTLRSFQHEIESFSHEKQRLALKEAREAHAAAEAAKLHKPKPVEKKVVQVEEQQPVEPEAEVEESIQVSTCIALCNSQAILLRGDDNQIRARLASALLRGHGELLLSIGQHPDETTDSPSISSSQLDTIVHKLRETGASIRADVTELYREDGDSAYGCWMIRLRPAGVEEVMEVRVAVVGNVDAGKSTTLGVLTRGGLDDGRGKARLALFRHPHEVETGRTSSVGGEILGFTTSGEPIFPTAHESETANAAKREKLTWEEICKRASKVVSFIDLAGHERYFKTTLYGLSGCAPDYVMLMVGGNAGLIGMSKEHLGVALALNVPIAVCVTKVREPHNPELMPDRLDAQAHSRPDYQHIDKGAQEPWLQEGSCVCRERKTGSRLCTKLVKAPDSWRQGRLQDMPSLHAVECQWPQPAQLASLPQLPTLVTDGRQVRCGRTSRVSDQRRVLCAICRNRRERRDFCWVGEAK